MIGQWIYTEFLKYYDNGATLLVKGFKCSNCGFYRPKRSGKSKYCEDCGTRMEGDM